MLVRNFWENVGFSVGDERAMLHSEQTSRCRGGVGCAGVSPITMLMKAGRLVIRKISKYKRRVSRIVWLINMLLSVISLFFASAYAQTISGETDCLPAGGFTLCQNLWGASTALSFFFLTVFG